MRNLCCIPGCSSQTTRYNTLTLSFFNFPNSNNERNEERKALVHTRRLQWTKAAHCRRLPEIVINGLVVCCKHFAKGYPARMDHIYDVDWVPSRRLPSPTSAYNNVMGKDAIETVIENTLDVIVQFDQPEYIEIGNFDENEIERRLIEKYLEMPICDKNDNYTDDHDYLDLPLRAQKRPLESSDKEHNYSLQNRPDCYYFNGRHFCNICSRDFFKNLFLFNKHLMKHTERNDVKCIYCGQTFFTSYCLNVHLNGHRHLCDVCGVDVPVGQLKKHSVLNKRQKMALQINTPKVFCCLSCQIFYYTEQQYKRHQMMVHRIL